MLLWSMPPNLHVMAEANKLYILSSAISTKIKNSAVGLYMCYINTICIHKYAINLLYMLYMI